MIWFSGVGAARRSVRKTTEPADSKSQIFHLLRLERQHARTTQTTLLGNLGRKKRYGNRSKVVENFITSARCRPFACMKLNCNSPSGVRAIYSEDDTRAGNIKKRLKEACGSDVKRQVVEFMYETASIKKRSKMQRTLAGHARVHTRKDAHFLFTSNKNVVLF